MSGWRVCSALIVVAVVDADGVVGTGVQRKEHRQTTILQAEARRIEKSQEHKTKAQKTNSLLSR